MDPVCPESPEPFLLKEVGFEGPGCVAGLLRARSFPKMKELHLNGQLAPAMAEVQHYSQRLSLARDHDDVHVVPRKRWV